MARPDQPILLSVAEAYALLQAARPDWGREELPLEAAAGRVLAAPVLADRDLPPFPRVTMDGVALAHAAWAEGGRAFHLAGVQAAGEPPLRLPDPASAIEVMTGAFLPLGCDCVVPVEELEREGTLVRLAADHPLTAGACVHVQGSDGQAGSLLLAPGTRLDSPALAVAASAGATRLSVLRRPRIALIATGSELVPPGERPLPWQIRASNGLALRAALAAAGQGEAELSLVDDDPGRLAAAIEGALARADLLVLSGAVSRGRFDHVPGLLREAGARLLFHGVAQRPGKPLLAAVLAGEPPRLVLGLPGNPVSALVCLHRYLLPLLAEVAGRPPAPRPVRLAQAVEGIGPLTLFLPVALSEEAGATLAWPHPTAGSGDYLALVGSAGFVQLDQPHAGHNRQETGAVAVFHPWS
ncbi:MAG: molybdopterin molybdotransferase MoeA [bacterium]|jgi:molybdopterin molybdotransferase|nr:molybdopterin molybdotransferase MoeA [bacterium]